MTDFSLIGYESIGVQEYLPILLNIIENLNFINDFAETKGIIQISRFNDVVRDKSTIIGSSCTLIETENYDYNGHIKAVEILVPSVTSDHEKILKDEDITALKRRIKELEEANDLLKHNFQEEISKTDKLKIKIKNIESLQEDIKNKKNIIELLENQIKELHPLEDSVHEKSSYISDLEIKIKKLESIHCTSDEMFQVYTDDLQSKRDNLRKKNNEITKLENTLEETEEKNQKIEKKCKGVIKQLFETEAELLECNQNLEKQKNINKTLEYKQQLDKEENEKYLKEIEELTKFYSAKLKDADEIATECVRLRKDVETGNMKVKDRDIKISTKDKSIKELNMNYENMEKKCGKMQEQLQKKQQALEVMKTKIRNLQNGTPNQSQEFNLLKKELSNKNEYINMLEIEITKLKDNLENGFQKIEMLKKEIITVTDELKNLKQLNFNANRNSEVVTMVESGRLSTQKEPETTPFPNWWKKHMNK